MFFQRSKVENNVNRNTVIILSILKSQEKSWYYREIFPDTLFFNGYKEKLAQTRNAVNSYFEQLQYCFKHIGDTFNILLHTCFLTKMTTFWMIGLELRYKVDGKILNTPYCHYMKLPRTFPEKRSRLAVSDAYFYYIG